MPKKKDAIIVHSGFLVYHSYRMDDETQARVDKGLELLANDVAPIILMNGGPGVIKDTDGQSRGYLNRDATKVHSDVMREYAIAKGVPPEKILTQRFSLDTVGEVLFGLGEVMLPRGIKDVVSVSVNYHGPRIQAVSARIWGSGYINEFVGVPSPEDKEQRAPENDRLRTFLTSFADIPTGDHRAFLEALYAKHGLYKGIPPEERRDYFRPTC